MSQDVWNGWAAIMKKLPINVVPHLKIKLQCYWPVTIAILEDMTNKQKKKSLAIKTSPDIANINPATFKTCKSRYFYLIPKD